MHMPLMINLRRVVVFGGERGEGLQKTEKLALYADSVRVVPESPCPAATIDFPQGPVRYVAEALAFTKPVSVPVARQAASWWNIGRQIRGADFVCSDLADRRLNERISKLCAQRGIRCNIIDTKDLGDTWFMSLVEVPGLLVGISSKGECAYAAKAARMDLQPIIANQGKISHILSQARAAFVETRRLSFSPSTPTPAKGALGMLEALHHDPEFRRLCAAGNWEAARDFALEHALNFAQEYPRP